MKPTFRRFLALAIVCTPFGCASDRLENDQAHEIEYEGLVHLRDCSDVIDGIIENWTPVIGEELCGISEGQLESITVGPIGPLDSSAEAKSAYRDFRRSCSDLKGQRRLLKPEEVNQFIKDSVLSALCGDGTQ